MIKKKTLGKLVAGLVLGALLVTSGGLVLASGDNSATQSTSTSPSGHMKGLGERGPGMGNNLTSDVLTELVSNGTLTQAQSDQLQALITEQNQERKAEAEKMNNMTAEERQALRESNKDKGEKTDLLTEAVNQDIITQEIADTIRETMQATAKEKQQTDMNTTLAALVDKGTITSAQSDAIIEQFNNIEEQFASQKDKFKNMTQEERQSYMEQNKPEKVQPLQALIDDGTLTQAQADAVAKVLPGGGFGGHGSDHSDTTGNDTTTE